MYNQLKTICNLNQLKIISKKLANITKLGDLFLLKGQLGAGKTSFARFFINEIFSKNLQKKPNLIRSPSFPIMINYTLKDFEIFHYDLYRINNKNEIIELNIHENVKNNVTLIEWPELIIENIFEKNYFLIDLKIIDENKRELKISHSTIKNILNND